MLGRPFYLMGFVDGWSPMDTRRQLARAVRRRTSRPGPGSRYQLVEGIALLSKVDWQAKGLEDLGRPDGFHERQVDRWTAFLERDQEARAPRLRRRRGLARARTRRSTSSPGIMHGDYQFANVMYQHGAPAQLAAIVDWEMGTSATRSSTSAWVVQSWPEDTSARRHPSRATSTCAACRRATEVLEHYAEVSGRQVDDIDYYVILAKWKLAIVLEQGFQRAGDDEKLQAFGPIVLDLMQGAAELAETTDYGVTS